MVVTRTKGVLKKGFFGGVEADGTDGIGWRVRVRGCCLEDGFRRRWKWNSNDTNPTHFGNGAAMCALPDNLDGVVAA